MRPSISASLLLILAISVLPPQAAALPGQNCRDCRSEADDCWNSSYDQFLSCVLGCAPTKTYLGCVALCELAWTYRNAQCGAAFLTCDLLATGCELTYDPLDAADTPILLDLDRNDFHLDGANDPVLFDIDADGQTDLISWTRGNQRDAFLCLDRNGNGTIDDGSELFGNHTPLFAGGIAPNGYIALQELDMPFRGGNYDGYIDAEDAMYGDLQVWIDSNHNGQADVGELSLLEEAGIERIGIAHRESRRVDQHGNSFRYLGDAWVLRDGKTKHVATVDVFFVRLSVTP